MNLRNTAILFVAVILVLVVFGLILTYGPRGDGDDYLIPDLRGKGKSDEVAEIKKSIDKVEVERLSPPGEPLLFEKEGTTWVLKKPYPARVDGSMIDRLVGSLIDAKLDRKAPPVSTAQAGLDSPSAAVSLIRGGKTYRIIFGQIGLGGGGKVYAATGDKPDKVLSLRRSAIDELLRPGSETVATVGEALRAISDFRPANLLADGSPIPWDVIQRITLREGAREIVLQKDTAGGWAFTKPNDYGPADLEGDPASPATQTIAGVKPLLTRLTGLRVPPPEDVIEGATDLSQYGLETGKESMRIDLGRVDGGSETLLVGKNVDPAGLKRFAKLASERFVVKLDARPLEQIRKLLDDPKSLRDRNLTAIIPFSIDAIDVKLPGEKPFELRRVGTPPRWRIFEGGDGFEDANGAAVNQLLDAITARRNIRDFPDSAPGDKAFGLDTPSVQVDLWQDGIVKDKKDEPKPGDKPEDKKPEVIKRPTLKGEPTLRLVFGKKDKDIAFVRRSVGILSNLVALPESTLTMATRPLTSYLDLTLPSFDRAKVTKLAFNRGEVRFVLEKPGGDPNAAGWKITQPADYSERNADVSRIDQMLIALSGLQASRVIARKATDAEVERFGLKSPRLEAIVTLKDVKEPRLYQFGNDTDDKLNVYARIAGSERVFVVEKARIEALTGGEIVDPTIWRIDASKIKGIKLTGWKSLTGGMPLTLDLQRKSATEWSVKDQADYQVDVARAEAFANSLAIVRTDKFVKHKGAAAPEHKVDAQADALIVEVTVDGEKEPFTLTLGADTKEGMTEYSFAISNKAPGAVFLAFKDRFAEIRKSGRGYFQKPK